MRVKSKCLSISWQYILTIWYIKLIKFWDLEWNFQFSSWITAQWVMSPLQQPLAIIVLTLRMSKTAASAFSLLRQARITLAPLFARSRAVALPMPVLLPVQDNDSHILIHTYPYPHTLPHSPILFYHPTLCPICQPNHYGVKSIQQICPQPLWLSPTRHSHFWHCLHF